MPTLVLDDVRTDVPRGTVLCRAGQLHGNTHRRAERSYKPTGQYASSFGRPPRRSVHLERDGVESVLALESKPDGWHELSTKQAPAGTHYRYVLPDGTRVPDPASRFQPQVPTWSS
jgi:1,4-alpha-glucan branching enzyme